MPLGALSALMGLAGGAQAVGQGLGGLSQRFATRDAERQRTALQLLLAGYNPVGTPTAANHPVAVGQLAHSPAVPNVVSVPELQAPPSPYGDPMAEQGGGALAPMVPQMPVPAPQPYQQPAQPSMQPPGAALSALVAPRSFDVPGMGAYEEAPQAVQARQAAAVKQQADIARINAEADAARTLADERRRPPMSVVQTDHGLVRIPTQGDIGPVEVPGVKGPLGKPDATSRFTTYQDTDPETGKPRTMRLNTTTGEISELGGGKQTGGAGARGFGAGGIFGGASGLGSIREMHAALPNLEKYEFGLLAAQPGDPGLKLFDTYRQNILNAGRHAQGGHGAIAQAISNATQTAAAEELVRINPALAEYARNMAQWIVADLNLTRSASDERGRMDQIASSVLALPVSDMPFENRRNYIQQIIKARRERLAGLDKVVPAAESMLEQIGRQGGHPTPKSQPISTGADPEFDALMASLKKP